MKCKIQKKINLFLFILILYSIPFDFFAITKNDTIKLKDNEGVIYTGNPKILKKICPGVYGTIKPVGYCMIGRK